MTTDLPTAAEMRAAYNDGHVAMLNFVSDYWPAIIAMREELDRLRERDKIHRDALVSLKVVADNGDAGFFLTFAKDEILNWEWILEDHKRYIADADTFAEASRQITDLEKQLAESRAECERLRAMYEPTPAHRAKERV